MKRAALYSKDQVDCLKMLLLVLLFRHVLASTLQPDVYCPFDVLDNGVVKGREYDGALLNSPRLVAGILGNAIELNPSLDVDQTVNFGNLRHTCFGNPDNCSDGFTLSFWMNMFPPRSSTVYIMSNGGQTIHSHGIAIYLRLKQIHVSVRLKSGKKWSCSIGFKYSAYMVWTFLSITWSSQKGVGIFRDGDWDSSASWGTPGAEPNTTSNDFVIGSTNQNYSSSGHGSFIIDDLRFWNKMLNQSQLTSIYQDGVSLESATDFTYEPRKLDPFAMYQSPSTGTCQRIQPEEPYVRSALLEVNTYTLGFIAGSSSFLVQAKGDSNVEYVGVSVVNSACRALQSCRKTLVTPYNMMATVQYNCSCPARDCDILYLDLSTPIYNCPSNYISCLPVHLCRVDVVF